MKNNTMRKLNSGRIMAAVAVLAAITYSFSIGFGAIANNVKEVTEAVDYKSISTNHITLDLVRGYQDEDHFQVDICYTLPDQRDWLIDISPSDTLLKINGENYAVSEARMSSRNKGLDGNFNMRCEGLLFPVQQTTVGTPFQISISKIFVSESETIDCPLIQKKIEVKQPGILIQCANGKHMSGFHAISWPAEMTQKVANELAHDIVNDAQTGPWIFTGVSD